jgi:hypothetical protein
VGIKEVLPEQVAVVLVHQALLEQQELQTRAAVAAVLEIHLMAALAVPALSSCPIPCQKAQQLNSCLLQHGKHQQASLPLTTWW